MTTLSNQAVPQAAPVNPFSQFGSGGLTFDQVNAGQTTPAAGATGNVPAPAPGLTSASPAVTAPINPFAQFGAGGPTQGQANAAPVGAQPGVTMSKGYRVLKGVKDSLDAGAQGLAHLMPQMSKDIDTAARFMNSLPGIGPLTKAIGMTPTGAAGTTPADNVDKDIADSETKYQADKTAAGVTGPDWYRLGGNIAATLPAAIVAGPAAGAGALATIGNAALVGGGLGLMTPVTDPSRQKNFAAAKATDAAIGAGTAGLLAPLAPAIGYGAKKAWEVGSNLIKPFTEGGRKDIVGRILSDTTGGQPIVPETPAVPGLTLTTGQASNQPGLMAVERSASSTPDAMAATAETRAANNQVLRDTTKGLGEAGDAPKSGEQLRTTLNERAPSGTPVERVQADLEDSLGLPGAGSNYHETYNTLAQVKSQKAGPMFEKAMEATPVHNDQLARMLQDPDIMKGLKQGLLIERRNALAEGRPFDTKDFAVTDFNAAGDPIISGVPNMKLLSAAKEGLDDTLEQYRDPLTGKLVLDKAGVALNKLRASFVKQIDKSNPLYANARAEWAGPSQSQDALAFGRNIFKPDTEVGAQRFMDMSSQDQDFARIGVTRAVQDLMSSGEGPSSVAKVFSNPSMRAKLQGVFKDPQDFDNFLTRTNQEISPDSQVAKILKQDATGKFTLPDSAVADQVLFSGKGAPEALNNYLSKIKGSSTEDAARDALKNTFTSKLLDQGSRGVDSNGEGLLSSQKISNFLEDHQHVMNSDLFTPAQKDLVQALQKGTEQVERKATAVGRDNPYSGLASTRFMDLLVGKLASKAAERVTGAVAGTAAFGPMGGAAGAVIGDKAGGRLASLLYEAPRDKALKIFEDAMKDPALAETLRLRARPVNVQFMPSKVRSYLTGVLGAEGAESAVR